MTDLNRKRTAFWPSNRPVVFRSLLGVAVPPGSKFKGYELYEVQDLVLSARAVCYRRERWLTLDGKTILAPLPSGIRGHFGPELRRFVLMQYHQCQVTVERLVVLLQAIGVSISKRQIMRLLIDGQDDFLTETRDVSRAGLQTAGWVAHDPRATTAAIKRPTPPDAQDDGLPVEVAPLDQLIQTQGTSHRRTFHLKQAQTLARRPNCTRATWSAIAVSTRPLMDSVCRASTGICYLCGERVQYNRADEGLVLCVGGRALTETSISFQQANRY